VADCPAGTNITLIHNEILNPDGTVNRNLARMQSQYICAGGDSERYRTQFTYMGFRYVQVENYPGVPGEDALRSHFTHSEVPQAGEFSSSNGVLNAIQHATRYASLSNLVSVPTDCPQRERFGWLGDAQVSERRRRARAAPAPAPHPRRGARRGAVGVAAQRAARAGSARARASALCWLAGVRTATSSSSFLRCAALV
jgi:hypothetical protein